MLNIAKYLKFHCQKAESTRNGKLRRLSGRFQTVPGSQIVGKTRKSRASENGGGAGKKGKGGERERVIISKRPSSAASPSPQFPPVFFLFRAFSIPRARLSRNLEQAISDSNLETGRNGSKSQVKSPGLSGRVDSPDVRYNFDLRSHVIAKRGNCSDDIAQ